VIKKMHLYPTQPHSAGIYIPKKNKFINKENKVCQI